MNEAITEQIMTQAEIEAQFENEWILVEDPQFDANDTRLRGKVLWHSKDQDEVYRKDLEWRIQPAGSPAHYEARVGDNHHHLVCRNCGATQDVDCAAGAMPCLEPSANRGFVIDEAEIIFWGVCPSCQRQQKEETHEREQGNLVRQTLSCTNDYKQAGERYRMHQDWERDELISNPVGALKGRRATFRKRWSATLHSAMRIMAAALQKDWGCRQIWAHPPPATAARMEAMETAAMGAAVVRTVRRWAQQEPTKL